MADDPAARTQEEVSAFNDVYEMSGFDWTTVDPESATAAAAAQMTGTPVRGEDYTCNSGRVRCATAGVYLDAGVTVIAIERHVREGAGGPWVSDPGALGWCSYEAQDDDITGDGRRHIWVRMKNWSHNRTRLVRITVYYHR